MANHRLGAREMNYYYSVVFLARRPVQAAGLCRSRDAYDARKKQRKETTATSTAATDAAAASAAAVG